MDGYEFAIGPGAWHWGSLLTSRDYSALASPERRYFSRGQGQNDCEKPATYVGAIEEGDIQIE